VRRVVTEHVEAALVIEGALKVRISLGIDLGKNVFQARIDRIYSINLMLEIPKLAKKTLRKGDNCCV